MRISGATYYLNYYKKKSIHAKPKRVLFNFLIVGLFTLELLFIIKREFLVMVLQQRNKIVNGMFFEVSKALDKLTYRFR